MANLNDIRPLGETLNERQKWLLIASLMVSMFIGALDQTIMATATPKILADLGGFALLSWVFTTYTLASTVIVPLVGKLSDIYGRKYFVMGGIVVFMLASAACGAATSMPQLITARAVQGIGGGMIFASVFSTIGDIFPPVERGKYMGLFTGTFSLASILGPTLGGFITDSLSWRWVFYINVPFALIALPAIWHNLPAHRSVYRPKIDFLGSIFLSIGSVSLLLALVWSGEKFGWFAPQTAGLLAIAAAFVALFIWQEARHPEPIIPLHLFRNREFVFANLVVFTIGAGMFGAITYLPTFVQTALGASAAVSGVITTPQSAGVLFTSILGGQLMARTGRYRTMVIFGASLVLTSLVLLLTLDVGSPEWHVSVFMVISGLGFGLVLPTMSVVTQNAVPHEFLGVATSARQFFMQIGQVMGIAIFGVVLASSYQSSFDSRLPEEARAQAPAATLQKFDDPTLSLDKNNYAAVQAEILALPGGQPLLDTMLDAQKESVSDAFHHVLLGSVAIILGTLVLALCLKELPLRTAFGPASDEHGEARAPIPIDLH